MEGEGRGRDGGRERQGGRGDILDKGVFHPIKSSIIFNVISNKGQVL